MANQGIFVAIQKGISEAIADIREKVVEEPMWGRSLTDHGADAPIWQPETVERPAHPLAEMQNAQGIWQDKGDQAKRDRDQSQDKGMDR